MNFSSYNDPGVTVAVALVNALTNGWVGHRPLVGPSDPVERRRRALTVLEQAAPSFVMQAAPAPEAGDDLYQLAASLRAVFEAAAARETDRAAGLVNELLRHYRATPHLITHDREPWHLHFHSVDTDLAAAWGAQCASGLAVVIGGGDLDRLGVCQATRCDRVFVDTSRNGSRRFCSPPCLNRTKIAALRARATASGTRTLAPPAS